MNRIARFFSRFDRCLAIALRGISLVCFSGLLILLSAVVFVRFVPITSLGWSDEIVEWAFAWMVFMGAAILWRDNEHFRVKWLEEQLEGRKSGKVIGLVVELLSIIFLFVMTYYGMKLMLRAHDRSPILELPRHIWYLCVPLAGAVMIGYSIRNLVRYSFNVKQGPLGKDGTEMTDESMAQKKTGGDGVRSGQTDET
jgi:TRAP-type C4-dicarboxylate transport system permease small subunit